MALAFLIALRDGGDDVLDAVAAPEIRERLRVAAPELGYLLGGDWGASSRLRPGSGPDRWEVWMVKALGDDSPVPKVEGVGLVGQPIELPIYPIEFGLIDGVWMVTRLGPRS
jgi:hypothetical protein